MEGEDRPEVLVTSIEVSESSMRAWLVVLSSPASWRQLERPATRGNWMAVGLDPFRLLGTDVIASNTVTAICTGRRIRVLAATMAPTTDELTAQVRHVEGRGVGRSVPRSDDAEQPRVVDTRQ